MIYQIAGVNVSYPCWSGGVQHFQDNRIEKGIVYVRFHQRRDRCMIWTRWRVRGCLFHFDGGRPSWDFFSRRRLLAIMIRSHTIPW